MIKNEKGITLMTLAITIVVMLILASTTAYIGNNIYKEAKLQEFITQMQLIQKKVDTLVSDQEIELGTIISETGIQTQIEETINKAIQGNEITQWDIETHKIKYFSKADIKNILDIDNIDYDIIINFDTREVVSLEGIEYEETIYYTQYNLPQGQKVSQYNYEGIEQKRKDSTYFEEIIITRDNVVAENITIDNSDGLNCAVLIKNIGITNGTLKYQLNNEEWRTITNNTKKGKDYAVQVSKSGTYKVILIDNTTLNEYEVEQYVEVINAPQKNQELNIEEVPTDYDYSNLEESEDWAYTTVAGIVTYLWIPRFASKEVYYTDNSYTQIQEEESDYKKVEIKFTKGTTNLATDDTFLDETWDVSEKFVNTSGKKITGIWVEVNSTIGNNLLELIQQNPG